MNKTHLWAGALVVAGVAALAAPQFATAGQSGKSEDTKRGSARSGADRNIKSARPTNTAGKPAPKPPQKGGQASSRGSTCELTVDNFTGWYIDIYLDGNSAGTVSPYGTAKGYVNSGRRSLYAKAPGTSYTWGPRSVTLTDEFTWNLYD